MDPLLVKYLDVVLFQAQEQYNVAEMKHAEKDSNILTARYSRRPQRATRNLSSTISDNVECSRAVSSNISDNNEKRNSTTHDLPRDSTSENQKENNPDIKGNVVNVY